MIPAVVIAAGLGTRLRPLTERYAKPVLPIDGRPVLASLLRELAAAGCPAVTVVTGHLADQVERIGGDGRAFGLELRYARQARPDGSTDAVLAAAPRAPYLVVGADTLFAARRGCAVRGGLVGLRSRRRARRDRRAGDGPRAGRARRAGSRRGARGALRSGRSVSPSQRSSRRDRAVRHGSSRRRFSTRSMRATALLRSGSARRAA